MRFIKAFLVLTSFIAFLVVAAVSHVLITIIRPSARWRLMARLVRGLIRILQFILGIKINLKGNLPAVREQGNFIISRHVGYLDGIILGGIFPANLISKKKSRDGP